MTVQKRKRKKKKEKKERNKERKKKKNNSTAYLRKINEDVTWRQRLKSPGCVLSKKTWKISTGCRNRYTGHFYLSRECLISAWLRKYERCSWTVAMWYLHCLFFACWYVTVYACIYECMCVGCFFFSAFLFIVLFNTWIFFFIVSYFWWHSLCFVLLPSLVWFAYVILLQTKQKKIYNQAEDIRLVNCISKIWWKVNK